MGFIFLIIGIVVLFKAIGNYGSKKPNSKNTSNNYSVIENNISQTIPYTPPRIEKNTLKMKHTSFTGYWNELPIAKYNDGKIYILYSSKPELMGYYNTKNGQILVSYKDNREIGSVMMDNDGQPNLIYLSNFGWYEHMGLSYDRRKQLSFLAAEIFCGSNIILDNETSEVVAEYNGDPIGAAAAFICVQYECASCGKYYKFYHD